MVIGCIDYKRIYAETQYILAATTLYWYIMLLFVLLIPIVTIIFDAFDTLLFYN